MNILVDNFSNNRDSLCLYLYHALKEHTKANAFFWSSKAISAYDVFDDVKPDVFITHCKALDNEVAAYIDDKANRKDLIVVLFVNGITQEEIEFVESTPIKKNSRIILVNSGQKKIKSSLKFVSIWDCVDDKIEDSNMEYNIPIGYHIKDNDQMKPKSGSYHYLSNNNGIGDVSLPQQTLSSLYRKYNEIVFNGYDAFDQSFFDALYRTPEVYYISDDKKLDELSEKLFGCVLNYNNKGKIDFAKVKKVLKEKHLPKNRVKQLLSQLPINQKEFIDF